MQLLGQQFPLTHIPLHAFFSEFSEGSFKVIIYGKLLRFNDIYGVLCLTAATNTNAADNNSSYLTERILHSVIGRRKRVHNGVDVQFISSVL